MTKQSAGDSSIVVSAQGAVHVSTGLTMSETKELFRLMLHESLAGLQAEAMKVAEERNEKLLDDLIQSAQERFGSSIEEKLSEFRDPGAQYAFRNAQTEYCKYGNEDAEGDAIELLISRISESDEVSEKIIYDEAIRVCGRLNKKQIDLICFYISVYVVRFGAVRRISNLEQLYRQAEAYIGGLECTTSDLAMMSYSGLIYPHVGGGHYNPLSRIIKSKYQGLFFKGLSVNSYNLANAVAKDLLVYNIRAKDLAQPNAMTINEWVNSLRLAGYGEEEIAQAKTTAENNLFSDDDVFDQICGVAPKFAAFRDVLEKPSDGILSYQLSPVGRAIGVARLRRDKWQSDLKLSQII